MGKVRIGHEDNGLALQAGKVNVTPTVAASRLAQATPVAEQPQPTKPRLDKDSGAVMKLQV
jgi:hypothetical protein